MSNNAKAALVVVVAFVGGLFVGIAGDRLYLIRTHQFFPRRAAEFAEHRLVNRLQRELSLTDQQRVAVERIVAQRHAHVNAIWDSVRPRVRAEITAANAEIEKLLTPDQRTKFRSLQLRTEQHRGRGPRPF